MSFSRSRPSKDFLVGCFLVGLVIAFGAAGCQANQCERGQIRCNGNVAEYCGEPGTDDHDLVWNGRDCGQGFCQPIRGSWDSYPICSLGEGPDPRCAGADGLQFCDGNTVVVCHLGYVVTRTDCTTGNITGDALSSDFATNGHCVSSETWASCALDAAPSPLCTSLPPGRHGTVCDGNDVLECGHGYALRVSWHCESTQTCVLDTEAFCSATATPDRNCLQSDPLSFVCKDGNIADCHYGYVQAEKVCPSGTTCQLDHGTPYCESR